MSRMLLIKMTPPLHDATLQALKPVCQKNQVSALGSRLYETELRPILAVEWVCR
jgi:hypothetical protein